MSNVKFKNPNAPATDKQVAFYNVLAAERGLPTIPAFTDGTTVKDASEAIDALKELPKAQAPSLTEMAAAIGTGAPVPQPTPITSEEQLAQVQSQDDDDLEAQAPIMLAFNRDECKALKSALSVCISETDGGEMDHVLVAKIDAFLANEPQPTSVQLPHYVGGGTVELTGAGTVVGKAPKVQGVPEGHYAVVIGGHMQFFRVEHGKAGGKWEGFTFLSKQVSDDYLPIKNPALKAQVLTAIKNDPLAAAKAYGTELGVCGVCHKTLTDPESIANGIGPVCAKRLGA